MKSLAFSVLPLITSTDYARKRRMVSGDNEDINVVHNSVESEGEVILYPAHLNS